MRFARIFAAALIGAVAVDCCAQQTQPAAAPTTNVVTRPAPATTATTNLLATNGVIGTNLFARTGAVRPLGLMEAIQSSVTNNYDVRIDRLEPEISKADIQAAKGAYDPVVSASGQHREFKNASGRNKTENLSFGLNGELPTGTFYDFGVNAAETGSNPFLAPPFRTGNGDATVLKVTQPLLRDGWYGQARYNIAISRKNLKISELALRVRLLSTVSQVEQAYFEWIASREQVRVQEEAVSLARQEAREMNLKAQIGVAEPLLAQSFESQAASSEADLLTARRNVRTSENTLVNLITRQFEAWHDLTLEPADQLPTLERNFDLQGSWSRAFEHRPDLHQLIIDLEKLGLTEKLRYNQIFPTLDLTGAYGYTAFGDSLRGVFDDLSDANKPTWSVGLNASFPIGNRTARATLRATHLQIEQANERLKQARQTIMVQVENAINDARTAWERIPATRVAREYAASALDAYKKRYAAGAIKSLDVLTQQRALTAARSDEIRALVDYNRAVTILLEREGTLLDERGLKINVQ
jgi:outer membrane protein